jgi:7-carboxy-7-deazaguanine synthase
MKRYTLKESFYSLQGEGVRAGTPAVFFRFSGCNLACNRSTHSFDCDTDFVGGEKWSAEELVERAHALGSDGCRWIILTGGEPALQLDAELIRTLKKAGYRLAIETNGTRELPEGLDWICVSPKVAEDRLAQRRADELKYVLREGDPLPSQRSKPSTSCSALHSTALPRKHSKQPARFRWLISAGALPYV